MYVCTRSVQTYLVKGSRGCNRLLLPWIGCDQFGHNQFKKSSPLFRIRWKSWSTTSLPCQKGDGESPTPSFYRGFPLYGRMGELALFVVYLCTRFVQWLRQISSRHSALWVQSRCIQIEHTYKIHSLSSEPSRRIACSHFGNSQPIDERISPFCYVRAYRTCTYVHSEIPKTCYIRNPLRSWSGCGHFVHNHSDLTRLSRWQLGFDGTGQNVLCHWRSPKALRLWTRCRQNVHGLFIG